eukprot:545444-Pelagomonas_calceolata.AAC.4
MLLDLVCPISALIHSATSSYTLHNRPQWSVALELFFSYQSAVCRCHWASSSFLVQQQQQRVWLAVTCGSGRLPGAHECLEGLMGLA